MDTTRFIFFDETAANTKMTRLYGRAPIGERLVASVPHGHWKTTTFVAGLGLDGTRYDRNAVNFLAAVCIAATVAYWL